MPIRQLVVVFVLSTFVGGCLKWRANDCEYVGERAPSAPSVDASAPLHPDFDELRAFRSYLRLEEVGTFAHHFTIWSGCVEPGVDRFEVSESDDGPVVRWAGGAWGGLGVRRDALRPIPEDQRERAVLVREHFASRAPNARDVEIEYVGSYRPLTVVETMPMREPEVGPLEALAYEGTVTFAANAELTAIDRVVKAQTGITRMCWARDARCRVTPRWIRFEEGTGVLVLPGEASWRAAADEILTVARGDRVLSLAELHEGDAPSLLPDGLAQEAALGMTVYARGEPQIGGPITLTFDASRAVFGAVDLNTSEDFEGHALEIRARLSSARPPSVEATGHAELPVRLELAMEFEGRVIEKVINGTADVYFDRGRAALSSLSLETSSEARVEFPAFGRFSTLSVYVDSVSYPRAPLE